MASTDHEMKMFNLQQQVRQNQGELEEYLKEMNNWEEEVKRKESDVLKQKPNKAMDIPPVRNCMFKKKKKKVKKSKDETGKPSRISGYDYRKWDKFNVDKELEKIEAQEKSESSEYETDEEWEMERKKHMANLEKEKGNDNFKRQDYALAIEGYTKAIELDPTNAIMPANRAMALLKQEKYGAAEADCLQALSLDPLYVKAYLRLGAARFELKKLDTAKDAFEKALRLEPQNKTAQKELERIEKELTKDKMVEQKDMTKSPDEGLVKPITKPSDQKSKKPLVRIQIEEIGGEDDTHRRAAIEEVEKSQSEAKKQITSQDNKMFEKFTSSTGSLKSTENHRNSDKASTKIKESVKTLSEDSSIKLDLKDVAKSIPDESKSVSPRSMPVPQSSFQFQTDYKELKSDLRSFYVYLKKINPEDYPKLFGQFLDAEIVLNMLNVFKNFFIPAEEDFYTCMCHLAKVKRFNMTVMFFSKKEKSVISELIGHLQKTEKVTSTELQKLKKIYEIS